MITLIRCNKCDAPVFWVKMLSSGKRNLLDAEPSAKGDLVIESEGDGPIIARAIKPNERPMHPVRYTSHFGSCRMSPIAEEMRLRARGMRA